MAVEGSLGPDPPARGPLTAEEAAVEAAAQASPEPVRTGVAEVRAGGSGGDHEGDLQVARGGEDAGRDHGGLARHERDERVEGSDTEDARIRPRGRGDDV